MHDLALAIVLGTSSILTGTIALVGTLRPLIAYELADLRVAFTNGGA